MLGRSRILADVVDRVTLVALVVALFASQASGEIPRKINYQGRLLGVAGEPLAGSHNLIFRICDDAAGGTALWSESQAVTADTMGVFAVVLGAVDSIGVTFDSPRWLEIEVDGEVLAPRREMVSVPFAFQAVNSHLFEGLHPDAFADSTHGHRSLEAADGNPARAVFADGDGRVGIGTEVPQEQLEVAGTTRTLGFQMPTGAVSGRVLTSDGTGTGTWQAPQASPDADWVIAGDKMYAGVSGNIGIGISNPLYQLHVYNSATDPTRHAIYAYLASATAASGAAILGGTSSAAASSPSIGVMGAAWSSAGSGVGVHGSSQGVTGRGIEAFAVHGSGVNCAIYGNTYSPNGYAGYFAGGRNYFQGKVGVGTSDPMQKLHLYDYADGALRYLLKLDNPSNSAGAATGILFKVDTSLEATPDRGKGGIVYERTDTWNRGDFHILQNSSANTDIASLADAVVTVTNKGRVGMGTQEPRYSLHVVNPSSAESSMAVCGHVYGPAPGYAAVGVYGRTDADTQFRPGAGVVGWASSPDGSSAGVEGSAAGVHGDGVVGYATHSTGTGCAVRGVTLSPDGYAGYFLGGRNYFQRNVGIGTDLPEYPLQVVTPSVPSSYGAAIHGHVTEAAGTATAAVWGETDSHASAYGDACCGVRGTSNVLLGPAHGVEASAVSDSGVGVYAAVVHATGFTRAVYGQCYSPNGYAGYFTGGRNYFGGRVGIGTRAPLRALHIYEDANGALAYPIKLENYGSSSGTAIGILFKVDGGNEDRGKGAIVYERTDTWNRGDFHILQRTETGTSAPATLADAVVTVKNNGKVGIGTKTPGGRLSVVDSVGTKGAIQAYNRMAADGVGAAFAGNNMGLWTDLNGCGLAATGNKWGLLAVSSKTTLEAGAVHAIFVDGSTVTAQARLCYRSAAGTLYKVHGDGASATVMATSAGKRTLVCPESPEAWFEDYGSGEIKSGSCHVDLDPLFLDCITVNEEHPLKVFVQLTAPLQQQYYVKKGETGFDVVVVGPGAGAADATFDYKVVGKWRGNEDLRFERVTDSAEVVRVSSAAGE